MSQPPSDLPARIRARSATRPSPIRTVHVLAFPVRHEHLQKQCVSEDRCPECGGELDTGWECNGCGFDARPIARSMRP